MNTIKFSHSYSKMDCNTETAGLMFLSVCDVSELHKSFVEYDTKYWNPEMEDKAYYELPKTGKVIVLLLYDEKNFIVFTTIRRWTPEKEVYYRSQVGKLFRIEITG